MSKKPDNTALDEILAQFVPYLQNFVIRWEAKTKWFGHWLIKLNPRCHQDVQSENVKITSGDFMYNVDMIETGFEAEKDTALMELQAKWNKFPDERRTPNRPEQLAFNTLCRLQWRSTILATLPSAAGLFNAQGLAQKLDLSVAEALEFFRRRHKIKNNQYYTYSRQIVESKLLYIFELIEWPRSGKDYQGEEQKLIIMSTVPQIVFATYMVRFTLWYPSQINNP